MIVCFIPHTNMAARLPLYKTQVLEAVCSKTGASTATYHNEDLRYIRLVDPTMSVTDINNELANSFAKCPVWTE